MTSVVDQPSARAGRAPDPLISRVPFLPGLDALRAIAVVAVMIYHANSEWLPGGYLGVEMFFVISGYLITLLLVAEQERSYRISLGAFWMRRVRRLLPALGLLLVGVTIWTALFEREALGALRGDVVAGIFYGSNWYQLWVGLGYTAAGDFAPLRHLWSLAVEEQFYLLWPLVMVVLLRRRGTRSIATVSGWLIGISVALAAFMAWAHHDGPIGQPNQTPEAYFEVFGRAISTFDFLYLGSITRMSGILLGCALALVWRPYALRRSRLARAGRPLDLLAVIGLVGLGWMFVAVPLLTDGGSANGTLFRGGMLVASACTVLVIAAIAHPASAVNLALDRRVLEWIGTRSYGLYLYHWPVYQAIRGVAGNKLTVSEFVVAMLITGALAEASYRFVELPVRERRFRATWRRALGVSPSVRRSALAAGAVLLAVSVFSVASLATAEVQANEIERSFAATEDDVVDLTALAADREAGATPTTPSTVAAPTPTTVADLRVPDSPTTLPPGEARIEEPVDDARADAGATTVPVVPATTAPPPPTTDPAPDPDQPITGLRSRGVVADLEGVVPLGIDPVGTPGATPVLALGDSVMRGAAEELSARGVVVDAVVSRQFSAYIPEVQRISDAGLIGSVVIVHLGTNGAFPESSADRLMSILADVPVVVFVTGKADRGWIAGNNGIIRALPDRYPNVTVLDWEVLATPCGDCFYSDRIHLDASGQQFYADLLGRLVGF